MRDYPDRRKGYVSVAREFESTTHTDKTVTVIGSLRSATRSNVTADIVHISDVVYWHSLGRKSRGEAGGTSPQNLEWEIRNGSENVPRICHNL